MLPRLLACANIEQIRQPKCQFHSKPLLAPRPVPAEQLGDAAESKMERIDVDEQALSRESRRVVSRDIRP